MLIKYKHITDIVVDILVRYDFINVKATKKPVHLLSCDNFGDINDHFDCIRSHAIEYIALSTINQHLSLNQA